MTLPAALLVSCAVPTANQLDARRAIRCNPQSDTKLIASKTTASPNHHGSSVLSFCQEPKISISFGASR